MLTDAMKQKMETLTAKMDNGSINLITRKTFAHDKYRKMGDKDETAPLPTLKGSINGVELTIEFIPYPDGGHLMDININAKSPVRLVMTLEGREPKSLKFKGDVFPPIQEIETGFQEFDDRYFIESVEQETVCNYLGDEETRKYIDDLGDFDKLTFQPKYMKVTYYIENLENMDIDWLFEKARLMTLISEKIQ